MGLCPKSFGPYFWGAFHIACLAAVDLESLKTFINTYTRILPCGGCREHFAELLMEHPIPDTDIFKWSIDIHNIVNIRIGKPVVSYEEALTTWLSGCEPEPEPVPEPLFDRTTVTLMVLMVAIVLALLMKNFRK